LSAAPPSVETPHSPKTAHSNRRGARRTCWVQGAGLILESKKQGARSRWL
jgi:hypothetical protein